MTWLFTRKKTMQDILRIERERKEKDALDARRTTEMQIALEATVREFLPKREMRHD